MDNMVVLKAIADETRMGILTLLLGRSYCVRALARQLNLSEATISQHLKMLREAGLVAGEKRGYFTHYDVDRGALTRLAREIDALAAIERATCPHKNGEGSAPHGHCQCHRP